MFKNKKTGKRQYLVSYIWQRDGDNDVSYTYSDEVFSVVPSEKLDLGLARKQLEEKQGAKTVVILSVFENK